MLGRLKWLLTLATQVQTMISTLCRILIYLSSTQNSTQRFLPQGKSSSWEVSFPFTYYHPSLWKPCHYLWHLTFLMNIRPGPLLQFLFLSCLFPSILSVFRASTREFYYVLATLAHLIYPPDNSQIKFLKIQIMFYYFSVQKA